MLILERSHASALTWKKETISEKKPKESQDVTAPLHIQAKDIPRGLPATYQLSTERTPFLRD